MTTKITTLLVVFTALTVVSTISLTSVFANEQTNDSQTVLSIESQERLDAKINELLDNREILVDENRTAESDPNMSEDKIDLYNRMAVNANQRFALIAESNNVSKELNQGNTDASQTVYLDKIQKKISELQEEAKELVAENKSTVVDIDPTLLSSLKDAKQILQDDDELVVGVFVDKKSGGLIVHTAMDQQVNESQIRDRIEQLTDVPYSLKFVESGDSSCDEQDDDCNPLIGGISIHAYVNATHVAPCTISIPAIHNIWFGTEDGFISAGHCFSSSSSYDDVFQPTYTDPKVGEVTVWVNSGTCDCAFVKKTSGDTLEDKIWSGYGSTVSFTSKSDPSENDMVLMIGTASGIKLGEIINDDYDTTYSPVIEETMVIDGFASAGGDSGGPIIDYTTFAVYHGITKGYVSGDTIMVPWTNVDAGLDLQ